MLIWTSYLVKTVSSKKSKGAALRLYTAYDALQLGYLRLEELRENLDSQSIELEGEPSINP